MMGEELNATEVTKTGLIGDRAYALIDSLDGKVATAKNPRKWPTLFDFRAVLADAQDLASRCRQSASPFRRAPSSIVNNPTSTGAFPMRSSVR